MRTFRTEQVTVDREVATGLACDGCGLADPYGYETVAVVIAVNECEEGGSRDEYDFCNDCLVQRAPMLVAAGSRAPVVAGWPDADDAGAAP